MHSSLRARDAHDIVNCLGELNEKFSDTEELSYHTIECFPDYESFDPTPLFEPAIDFIHNALTTPAAASSGPRNENVVFVHCAAGTFVVGPGTMCVCVCVYMC